jgi:hypothetical protein
MMAILMASSAAIGLDVVEELALGVIGYLAPFDRRGRVGSFQARRKARLFFVGRARVTGGGLAGLQLVFLLAMFFPSVILAFALVVGV